MACRLTKTLVEIYGKQYNVDSFTNVTPKVLESVQRRLYEQRDNPLFLISERIRHFFLNNKHAEVGPNYEEFAYRSPVVTLEDNFDSLLIAKDHISRKQSDSYYVNAQHLLRSHTSAHQAHCLNRGSRAFISIADCYRRDEIDRSHFPVFHQCEVFKLFNHKEALRGHAQPDQLYDKSKSESKTKQAVYSQEASRFAELQLKVCVERFVRDFFDDSNLKTRWVDAYFPFTHPSFELEILWQDKWLEVLGCGVVRDEILQNAGIRDHVGFAAGFGLERFGMLKYEIPDIRLFWTRDSGFSQQFEGKSPFDAVKFKPFSNCPQCVNDLSFWLPEHNYEPNDFYDLCRSIGGDLVERVTLVDDFTHPKTKRVSHCYRIVYRAADRVLTKDEVNVIHKEIADASSERLSVELRT